MNDQSLEEQVHRLNWNENQDLKVLLNNHLGIPVQFTLDYSTKGELHITIQPPEPKPEEEAIERMFSNLSLWRNDQ